MNKNKKRVVIDASSLLPYPGQKHLRGIGRTTLELIRTFESFKELPVEIVLFTQRLNPNRLQKYDFSFPQYHLPLPRWKCFDFIKSKFPLVELITRADLLHIPHNYSPVFNPKKAVVTIHDAMFLCEFGSDLHDKKTSRKIVKLGRSCRTVITDSYHSKRDLCKYAGINSEIIKVISLGYNKKCFKKIEEQSLLGDKLDMLLPLKSPYIFSVSCATGRKRSPELVKEYLKVAETRTMKHNLLMAWKNPPNEIVKLIDNHAQGKRVKLLNSVTDQELSFLYNGASFFIFPSTYEGFGLPVLEAMACGTPVITTNISSIPEVGGDAVIYLDSLEDKAIGNAITNIENDLYDKAKFGKASLVQANKFSWEQYAHEVLEVYLKCLT